MKALVATILLLALCACGAGSHIRPARTYVDGTAMVLLETDAFLSDICDQRGCEGRGWEVVADSMRATRHTLIAADDALQAADTPEKLGPVIACVSSSMARTFAAIEAAGVDLPPVLAGWQQQASLSGSLCHWEPDPGAYVERGSAEGE